MSKRYYSIRFERDDAFNKAGSQMMNADNLLRIGQTESCDIRLANESQYEDAVIAVVEKRTEGKGWKLVKVSPYKEHEVRINGTPIDYVHFLSDGDHIAFEGQRQELTFNIHEDDLYTSNGIVQVPPSKGPRALLFWMLILTLGLCGFAGYRLYHRPITPQMVEQAKSSVFQLKVDSIQMVSIQGHDTTWLHSCRTDITGTAFLTTDSLLVTARHCIEPWLNFPDTTNMDTASTVIPDFVKWALLATTNEILANDSVQWLTISYCSVLKMTPQPELLFKVKSTEFTMEKSRDLIVEHGDFDHQYFWRSMSARPRRVNMMLGDIAWLPITTDKLPHPQGSIRIATRKVMQDIAEHPDNEITVLGFPKVEIGAQEMEGAEGKLKKAIHLDEEGYPKTVISHNGNLGEGFSGGPVLTKQGFKWYVIGVISVTDKYEKNHFYSVPITEIERKKETQKNH